MYSVVFFFLPFSRVYLVSRGKHTKPHRNVECMCVKYQFRSDVMMGSCGTSEMDSGLSNQIGSLAAD